MALNFPSSPVLDQEYSYNGKTWKWDGTAWVFVVSPVLLWTVKTANYTASSGDLLIADTSSGSFTITLPASPTSGSSLTIADGNNWAVANVTIARNGSTIEKASEDLYLDIAAVTVDLIYDGTTWQVFSSTGSKELTDTGVTATTYGGASFIPVIGVDATGRITSASNVAVVGGVSSVGGATGAVSNAQLYASFETAVPPGASGNVLASNGTDWVTSTTSSVFQTAYVPGTSGNVLVSNGTSWISQAPSGGGATVTGETASSSTYYPVFTTITTGSLTAANVATSKLYFTPSTGTLNATIFNSLSDITVKEDIVNITSGMDIVNQILPVSFTWRDNKRKSYGVIAQQIEKVLPEIIETQEETGLKSVSYTQIIPFLIQAIKELKEEIVILKGKK